MHSVCDGLSCLFYIFAPVLLCLDVPRDWRLTIKMHGRVLGHSCIQYCVLFLVAFITMSSATTLERFVYDRSAKYDVPMHYHYDQLLVLLESVLYTHLV